MGGGSLGIPNLYYVVSGLPVNAKNVQASTAFHLVYITAMRLIDIAPRKVEEGNRNRSFGPILLVLVHVAAVVISCVNFFIETVSIYDNSYNKWCLE